MLETYKPWEGAEKAKMFAGENLGRLHVGRCARVAGEVSCIVMEVAVVSGVGTLFCAHMCVISYAHSCDFVSELCAVSYPC